MGAGSSGANDRLAFEALEHALQEERTRVANLEKSLARERAEAGSLRQQTLLALGIGVGMAVALGCGSMVVLLRRHAAARLATEQSYGKQLGEIKRRAGMDLANVEKFAITAFARDLLTVADSLEEACKHAKNVVPGDDPGNVTGLADGVLLTEQSFIAALRKHGVEKQAPLGKTFNPNLHEALMQVPDASAGAGNVTKVLRSGFCINQRVLRAAQVAVASAQNTNGLEASGSDAERRVE